MKLLVFVLVICNDLAYFLLLKVCTSSSAPYIYCVNADKRSQNFFVVISNFAPAVMLTTCFDIKALLGFLIFYPLILN
jgi:hypothetical protein